MLPLLTFQRDFCEICILGFPFRPVKYIWLGRNAMGSFYMLLDENLHIERERVYYLWPLFCFRAKGKKYCGTEKMKIV